MTNEQRQLIIEQTEIQRQRLREECAARREERKKEKKQLPWYSGELEQMKAKFNRLQSAVLTVLDSEFVSDEAKLLFMREINKPL